MALPKLSRFVRPIVEPSHIWRAPLAYTRYIRSRRRYAKSEGAEALRWRDAYPQLWDELPSAPFDTHYFYQDSWAAQRVAEHAPAGQVDVGSHVDLVGFLTAITHVTFVDIRPLEVQMENLLSKLGRVPGIL